MQTIYDLPTPALLLDADALERNLRGMAERCRGLEVRLRPHVKTHKCIEIGLAQRRLGAAGITVSTLAEARAFAERGFDDITWAFPVIPSRLREAAELASRIRLGVVVDSEAAARAVTAERAPFRVWVKVDCGYGRAGVDPRSAAPRELAELIQGEGFDLAGLLSHSGNAYRAGSRAEIGRIADAEREAMARLAADLGADGIEISEVSVGSTPSMSACRDLRGVTEVRPGNYALNDYMQVLFGACTVADCAATVLSSVVSSSATRGTSVVDAGALAMSLDPGPRHLGRRSFGEVLDERAPGTLRRNARLTSLSQEHGVLSTSLPVGSRVRIVPNHSCLTVACFDSFSVVKEDVVLDAWRIRRER
jgi:D-serine deaminase-like pyridoxal phosphate-dependent protein